MSVIFGAKNSKYFPILFLCLTFLVLYGTEIKKTNEIKTGNGPFASDLLFRKYFLSPLVFINLSRHSFHQFTYLAGKSPIRVSVQKVAPSPSRNFSANALWRHSGWTIFLKAHSELSNYQKNRLMSSIIHYEVSTDPTDAFTLYAGSLQQIWSIFCLYETQ